MQTVSDRHPQQPMSSGRVPQETRSPGQWLNAGIVVQADHELSPKSDQFAPEEVPAGHLA